MLPGLKQRLARVLYPYGSVRPILRPPLYGMRFVVEPGIGVTYSLGPDGFEMRFIRRQVREGMTVYDIGANRGQMALLFSRLVGPSGRVLSFEPVPELYRSLKRNLQLNALTNVEARQEALAEENGTRAFLFSQDFSTQGKLAGVEPSHAGLETQTLDVTTVALDSLIESGAPAPDFLKIDVEGGAALVFRGARRLLTDRAPPIYLELHGVEEQAGARDYLLPAGYRLERLDGTQVHDPTARWENPLFCYRA